MPVIAKTNYEIRHQVMGLLGDGGINAHTFTPTSSGSATTLVCSTISGPGNDYYNNYRAYIYGTGAGNGTEVLITDFVDSSGTITWVGALTSTTTASTFEIHRPGWPTVQMYNDAINMAIQQLSRKALDTMEDRSIALEEDRFEYDVPSNFIYIHTLSSDEDAVGGDRHQSDTYDSAENFLQAAANTRLAQGFQVAESGWYDGIYIFMRAMDTPSFSIRGSFYTDISGGPSDELVAEPAGDPVGARTNTIAASDLPSVMSYVLYTLPRPYYFTASTQYHWAIEVTSETATPNDYMQLGSDTGAGYANGSLTRHNGSSWQPAVTGVDLIFRLRQSRTKMYRLPSDHWDLVGSTTRQIRFEDSPTDGRILRIEGQQYAGEPALDTSNVSVEASALTRVTAGILAPRLPMATANALNVDANFLVQDGKLALQEYRRVQPIPGSRIVESN